MYFYICVFLCVLVFVFHNPLLLFTLLLSNFHVRLIMLLNSSRLLAGLIHWLQGDVIVH